MSDTGQIDAPVAPSARLRLIRVKRKRGAEAPEDLVVEGLGVPGKRANTSLSSAMGGLGLEQSEAGAGGTAEAADEPAASNDAAADALARRPQRYRKLSTLSATQLRVMDQQQLHNLLVSGVRQEQEGRRRVGVKACTLAASAVDPAVERSEQRLQAGQSARYEHIRRRRGLSAFSITEQAEDPLQQLAAVYDVVRHEPIGQDPADGADAAGSSAAAASAAVARHHRQLEQQRSAAQQQRRPSRAQRAVQQYDEGTLMCNYLPMIRQYLESQGRHMPDPRPQPPPQQQQQQPAGSSGGQVDAAGMQEGEEEAGSDSEYVYDLYAAAEGWGMGDGEEAEEAGAGRVQAETEWWEQHASGHAPVVQILDDDTWVVLEQSDADDSNDGTEDSNAEGYYAHDYPEEASDLDSSDGGGYDPEGSTFAGSRRRQQDWDSDAGSSEEE